MKITKRTAGSTHKFTLEYAERLARENSKDPDKKVAALICEDYGDSLYGFNHIPEALGIDASKISREDKLKYTIHAEIHAILRMPHYIHNPTMYIGAVEPDGSFCGIAPCVNCALNIIDSGIVRRVVCRKRPEVSRWSEEWEESIRLFEKAGIEFIEVL